jgi:aspartate carbamoyltransferase regulatory subunit
MSDDTILCIIDCDVVPLKIYDGILPNDDEAITCDVYENWHMHIKDPTKNNFYKIEKYLEHTDYSYMDGGFVPIIINVKTLKKILKDIIEISEKLIDGLDPNDKFGWWGAMAGFQIACHNHKIKCISQNNTYVPNINELDEEQHYFCHYSCDPLFAKKDFTNWDVSKFKSNKFYNNVKTWLRTYQ